MVNVIAVAGKQYVVKVGQKVKIEGANLKKGDIVEYADLLGNIKTVKAKVLEIGRGKKVKILKYKNKTRYIRHRGYRCEYSLIEIIDEKQAEACKESHKAIKTAKNTNLKTTKIVKSQKL